MAHLRFTTALGALLTLTTSSAYADAPGRLVSQALASLPDSGRRFLALSGSGAPGANQDDLSAQVVVQVESRAQARALGLIPTSSHFAVGLRPHSTWSALRTTPGVHGVHFAPARSLLLDVATKTVELSAAHVDSGLTGEGSVVGIVDTGGDVAHPALRNADGSSRVAWMLVFGREPLGQHPEIEEEYGCNDDADPCAVYSRADINTILDSQVLSRLPKDRIGHGTHLASIAAGADADYPGVAPGADIILVSAAGETGSVTDARILLGTRFVFDRAAENQQPAAVNISLGSSFGAHDGSAAVEQGLAELAAGEGRAVVVAAGNSGQVVEGLSPDYPGPFGIHNQVAVPVSSDVRVPLLTTPNGQSLTEGSVFVWISTYPGEELSLGFHNGRGEETSFVGPGVAAGINSATFNDNDDYDVVILNGVDDELDADVMPGSVVVAIVGSWESGRTFELMLKGRATANLWVTGTGGAGASSGSLGPLLTRARTPGTVSIPGSHPDLLTVGASNNRSSWTDYSGAEVGYESENSGLSYFSSAGPNQLGTLKPELVAPGAGIVAAMSSASDPRKGLSPFSQFSGTGACPSDTECFVIDDEHGIASGTSMAAPMVTGALALLMQREPRLTMKEAKRYLMAGTARLEPLGLGSSFGTGELDIRGALLAQEAAQSVANGQTLSAKTSRTIWADDFAHPAPGPAMTGYVLTRDKNDEPIPVPDDLEISVQGPGYAKWEVEGPGLARLSVFANAGTDGNALEVTVSHQKSLVSQSTVPIARDPQLAEFGYALSGGQCTWRASSPSAPSGLLTLAFWGWVMTMVRSRRNKTV